MSATIGVTADYLNSYAYDELNRLISVTQTGTSVASKHVAFAYNALGQTTSVNRYNNSVATDPALRTVFGYDGANRLDAITHQKVTSGGSASTLHGYTFEFDDVGRITEIDSTLDGVSLFTFDKLNQLVGANHAGSRDDEAYELDATGNRDDSYYDVGTRNLTSTDGTYNYEYDKEGNRIKRTEISSGDYEVYKWDHRNRLVSIKSYASGGGAVTRSITYEYDAFNRLTHREYDSDGDGSGNPTDTFFAGFDGLGSTLEFDGNTASDLSHRYLWGMNDQLLADEIVDTTSEILWALADQVGTIRDIGRWNSSEFEIANHRVYDSFGNLTSESNSSYSMAYGFTGRWTDPETGLTHHLNRWFDPAIGKWLSNDPIGFHGGDANIQRYVLNNPLSYSDNMGFGIDPGSGGGGGGGGDDVMGTSGINQGANQGSSEGALKFDEGNGDQIQDGNVYIFVVDEKELDDLLSGIIIEPPSIRLYSDIEFDQNPFKPYFVPPQLPADPVTTPEFTPPWLEGTENPGITTSQALKAVFMQIKADLSPPTNGGFPSFPPSLGQPEGGVIKIGPTEIPIKNIGPWRPTISITPSVDQAPSGVFQMPESVPGIGGEGYSPNIKFNIELKFDPRIKH